MDLKSGYPYWTVKNLTFAFPQLDAGSSCDVMGVVRAGIIGAKIERRPRPLTTPLSSARRGYQ